MMNESIKQKFMSPDSTLNSTLSNNTRETLLVNENFYAFDKVQKIMLIGNKGVGKTTILTTLLNLISNDNKVAVNPKPTTSLEISKKAYKLKNNLIRLEFWDTNEQILLSPIIKSIYF